MAMTNDAVEHWANATAIADELDDQPWRRLIFAQFHDYITGSSIWEVYEEGLPELSSISGNALGSAARELGRG